MLGVIDMLGLMECVGNDRLCCEYWPVLEVKARVLGVMACAVSDGLCCQ